MPLVDISAEEAAAIRRGNPASSWQDRAESNRVEPIAAPTFDVPFRMQPGEAVFTVGSCFARNVEDEMLRRGFRVPARELLTREEFSDVSQVVLNNYGTPSIYNEFAWAFGEEVFEPRQHILEVVPGRYADVHFTPSIRPGTWDLALRRRQALAEMYRSVRDCRVVIMTLGLAEAWFDTHSGFYLNTTPRAELLKLHPGRFRMHVLSFDDAYSFIEKAIQLLKKHCSPDVRMLLTVSPVPLATTFRPQDIMVANTYSKSVLRAVAETVVVKHDFVSYFPSYESVMLSDRCVAFHDDMVHVTDDLVSINVARMLEAFVGEAPSQVRPTQELMAGSEIMAVYNARQMRLNGGEQAAVFFTEQAAWSKRSRDFALEHAKFLRDSKQPDAALLILRIHQPAAQEPKPNLKLVALLVQTLLLTQQGTEALSLLDSVVRDAYRAKSVWNGALDAAIAAGDPEIVGAVFARYSVASKKAAIMAGVRAAKFFKQQRRYDDALALYKDAFSYRPSPQLETAISETSKLAGQPAPV
jgi:hypothetical protein